jgi:hypothetical protein
MTAYDFGSLLVRMFILRMKLALSCCSPLILKPHLNIHFLKSTDSLNCQRDGKFVTHSLHSICMHIVGYIWLSIQPKNHWTNIDEIWYKGLYDISVFYIYECHRTYAFTEEFVCEHNILAKNESVL